MNTHKLTVLTEIIVPIDYIRKLKARVITLGRRRRRCARAGQIVTSGSCAGVSLPLTRSGPLSTPISPGESLPTYIPNFRTD